MLCIVFIVILVIDTSCRSVPHNGSVSSPVVSEGGVLAETVSGEAIMEDKDKKETSKRRQTGKKSFNITFQDALGNKQKLQAGEVDLKDMGVSMCRDFYGIVEGNHYYYMKMTGYMSGIEVYRDKGEKLGEWNDVGSHLAINNFLWWCKDKEKLYLLSENFIFGSDKHLPLLGFATIDLNSGEERFIDLSESYKKLNKEDIFIKKIYVYNHKIYIEDSSGSGELKEFALNGEQTRTISFKNSEGSEDNTIIQGIMDKKIYFFTWNGNQHVLRSRNLITGEEKKVLQYEQPSYNRQKWRYVSSNFHLSGNNLFVEEVFYGAKGLKNDLTKNIMYKLSLKNGGQMKCLFKRDTEEFCDFHANDIYYIDNKYLLHRYNHKKGTDKVISNRKLENVQCAKDGLFVTKYKEEDEDVDEIVEPDVIYYMDFDGKHEKKVTEFWPW